MFYPDLNSALNALSIALIVMIISMLGYLTRRLDENGDIRPREKRRRWGGHDDQDGPGSEIKGA